ncbi:unnamed protein product [Closterium sp. NIES-65]|nr:unnamed protein product [Closterium sp. NIES-65]
MVGYGHLDGTKAYRIYIPSQHRVILSRDVIFMEPSAPPSDDSRDPPSSSPPTSSSLPPPTHPSSLDPISPPSPSPTIPSSTNPHPQSPNLPAPATSSPPPLFSNLPLPSTPQDFHLPSFSPPSSPPLPHCTTRSSPPSPSALPDPSLFSFLKVLPSPSEPIDFTLPPLSNTSANAALHHHYEPQTIHEARTGPDAAEWIKAADAELAALHANDTYSIVPRPPKCKPIPCKWIFKVKENADVSRVYDLLPQMPAIAKAHEELCLRFTAAMNKLTVMKHARVKSRSPQAKEVRVEVYRVLLEGLTALVYIRFFWTVRLHIRRSRVRLELDLPFLPISRVPARCSLLPPAVFEQMVQHGFSQAELQAVLQLIAYIKGVAAMMTAVEGDIAWVLREAIHADVQEFARVYVASLLKRVSSSNMDSPYASSTAQQCNAVRYVVLLRVAARQVTTEDHGSGGRLGGDTRGGGAGGDGEEPQVASHQASYPAAPHQASYPAAPHPALPLTLLRIRAVAADWAGIPEEEALSMRTLLMTLLRIRAVAADWAGIPEEEALEVVVKSRKGHPVNEDDLKRLALPRPTPPSLAQRILNACGSSSPGLLLFFPWPPALLPLASCSSSPGLLLFFPWPPALLPLVSPNMHERGARTSMDVYEMRYGRNYGRHEADRSRRERSRERGRSLERSPRRPERSPRRPAFRADQVPLAPDRQEGGSAREGRGGSGSVTAGSDPWRTDGRHGADGGRGYRQDTGAYRSPEEGYRRREGRSRGRGLEGLFSGRQGDLDVDGEDEADSANRVRETNREGETKGDDEPQEEGAGEQREMPAGVDDDDPAQAGVAAEPSTAEAEEKGGTTRDLPRDGEKGDGGGRGSGARSPDPRQQRDEGRGDGARSPDPRLNRNGGRGGGARSPEPRLNRDGGRDGGTRSPDPRMYREGGRGGGARSPDPRQQRDEGLRARQIGGRIVTGNAVAARARQTRVSRTRTGGTEAATARQDGSNCRKKGAEAATARQSYGDTRTVDAGEACAHQIRGGITTGEAGGSCALQVLVTLVMRDAEATTARLICNGIMERGGEARRARPTGTGNMKKAGEADTARSFGNRAGMRGAAEGITHLIGTGSMTEDVPVREDGINAKAERKAAG